MGEMKSAYKISVGKPEGKGIDWRIILEWIFGKKIGDSGELL
jgi:hypothetical protein